MSPDEEEGLPYVLDGLRGYDSYKSANPYDSDPDPSQWDADPYAAVGVPLDTPYPQHPKKKKEEP